MLEQAEQKRISNWQAVATSPEMVTIAKSEYDLLIEIKDKFLK